MHVVCVGLATVDLVHRVARLPGIDEKVEAASVELAAGGPAATAAVTAAALGAKVTLVTAAGAHPLARLIKQDLDAYGVTLLDAVPDSPQPPPVSAVAVLATTGQRTVISRNAAGLQVGVPAGLDRAVRAADAVLIDGHHPTLALAAARAAQRAGRPVVIDAGSWRPAMAQILPLADVVACSAAFRHPEAVGPQLPADPATAAALRVAGVRHIAVTHGPGPVSWWSDDRAGTVEVPPVDAVDTTGAGDVFHGALAVAVARDPRVTDLADALGYAVAIAQVRVRHPGARTWLSDPALPLKIR
jgi:sugar/nucleoside kinase (ribokinase family)